jgi:hypothetical protein
VLRAESPTVRQAHRRQFDKLTAGSFFRDVKKRSTQARMDSAADTANGAASAQADS